MDGISDKTVETLDTEKYESTKKDIDHSLEEVTGNCIFAYIIGICIALGFGFPFTISNPLQNFISCWIEGIVTNNDTLLYGDGCDYAADLADNGELQQATGLWSIFSAVVNIGATVGALAGGPVCDIIGRKNTVIYNSLASLIICVFFSGCRFINNIPLFMIMRTLSGVTAGVCCTVGPLWLEEVAPLRHKGLFGGSFQMGVMLGGVLTSTIGLPWVFGTNTYWPYALLCTGVPSFLKLIGILFLPDTPDWYNSKDMREEAVASEKSLWNYSPTEKKPTNVMNDLMQILAYTTMKEDYASAFGTPSIVRALVAGCLSMVIQSWAGSNALFFYSTSIFQEAGFSDDACSVLNCLLMITNWLACIVAMFSVNMFGRVPLMFWSVVVQGISCGLQTLTMSFPTVPWINTLSLFPMFIFMIGMELGAGTIPWMLATEYVPIRYKAVMASFVGATTNLCAFVISLIFPLLQDVMAQYAFLIFVVVCIISGVWVQTRMVESKGRTVEEVQAIFASRTGWI